MKLRNKLVAVLAASMVVTSVPVVTMADTTNYMSTSRYAQKDSTFGFTNGSYAGYDNVYGQSANGIGGSTAGLGYDYQFSNGFEFTPVFDYNTTDTTYLSLTKDSEFQAKAIVAYVDAFNSFDGHTNLQFDADGKVVAANNPAYNGKTADELYKAGLTMYYKASGRVAYSSVSKVHSGAAVFTNTNSLTAADVDAKTKAVFDARVKAAGSSLYTASSNTAMLATVLADLQAAMETECVGEATAVTEVPTTVKTAINNTVAKVVTNNAEISTTYAQLYKSSNGVSVIDTAMLNDILTATALEVNSWAVGQGSTTYESWLRANQDSDAAVAVVSKDERIDLKDADDREYKSHMRVNSTGTFRKDVSYRLPVLAKLGGDKVVLLNVDGKDSNITSCKYSLTQDALTDKRLTVTADSEKIRTNYADKIGKIKFTESQIRSLIKEGNRKVKITLPSSSDLEFNMSKTISEAKVEGNRGFYNTTDAGASTATERMDSEDYYTDHTDKVLRIGYGISARRYNESQDTQTLVVELPYFTDDTSVGEMILSGIYVQPKDDVATAGEVKATISEYIHDDVNDNTRDKKSTKLIESTEVKVAEVKDYDIALTCEKPTDIVAGRSGIVNSKKTTFVLEEAVKDSLVDGRKIKFVVENGYIFGPADVQSNYDAANANKYYDSYGIYDNTNYKTLAENKFKELIANETIKFEEKAGKDGDKIGFDESTLSLEMDAEGRVIGFSAEYPRLKDTEADKIKVTMPIATDVMNKGEVKVKAENVYTRSFQDKEEDPSCVIANAVAPIEVTFDGAKLKVGKQAQEAGTITIKETDKGMLMKGLLVLAADNQDGIEFDAVPTVEVEGADGKVVKVDNVALSKDKTMLVLDITKTSTEASTIKISDIKLTADRTVPEANYDLAIWGEALTDENELGITNFVQNALYSNRYFNQTSDLFIVEDFIQMTTVNIEDLIGAAKAVTASFKIGENKFTVNSEDVSMDKAAYLKDNLTFVPVRYVAQAFGITGNQVQYDQKTSTATIVYGDKAINIKAGDAFITVNGTPVPMATKAEVVDGRMCVPMAYIANALGVNKSWDPATKTATFSNVNK